MLARFSMAVDRTLVVVAAIAFFVMLGITVTSVIGRYFFNAPIPDDIVFNELLMVFLVFLPFAYVQRKRQHVAVTLVSDWFSKRNQYYFEVFGNVLGLLIFCLISFATWQDFQSSWEVLAYNEGTLELPEYPSRFAVFFGVLVMTCRLLLDSLEGIVHLARGTRPEVEEPENMMSADSAELEAR